MGTVETAVFVAVVVFSVAACVSAFVVRRGDRERLAAQVAHWDRMRRMAEEAYARDAACALPSSKAHAQLAEVVRAYRVEGSNPEFHRGQVERLRREWPVLARALDGAGR